MSSLQPNNPSTSGNAPQVDLPGFTRPHAKPDPVAPRQTGSSTAVQPKVDLPTPTKATDTKKPNKKPTKKSGPSTTHPATKAAAKPKQKPKLKKAVPNNTTVQVSDIHQRRQDKQFNIQLQRLRGLAKTLACLLVGVALWYGITGLKLYKTPYTALAPSTQTRLTSPVALAHAMDAIVANQPNPYAWLLTPSSHYETELKQQLPFVYQASVQPQILPNRLTVALQEIPPWAILYTVPPTPQPKTDAGKPTPKAKKPLPISQRLHTLTPAGYMVASQSNPGTITSLPKQTRQRLAHYQKHPSQPVVNIIVSAPTLTAPDALPWQQIKTLAQWLHTLPRWQHAWIDCSITDMAIIRHTEGPDIIVGPLNHDWQKRFARLGTLLPYWQGWANTIEAIDLRWPTQITLKPKPGKRLPAQWEKILATPSDANKL